MPADNEVWKPIPGFVGYDASTAGRVRNRLGHVLAGTVTKKGYHQFNLRGARGRRVAYGHRLVAATFFGPSPPNHIVNHRNGDRLDNRLDNLEVVPLTGRARAASARWLGESNPHAKLTADGVREMRVMREQGMSCAELGRRFGVTERAVHRVVTRKDWKHIA